MTTIKRSALVPYSANEMYELVNAVDEYADFLPWCESTQVLARDEDSVKARITLKKGSLRKSFSTENRLQPNKVIEMRLLDGPFKHLEGYWLFDSVDESACRVSLDLEFEFSSRMLGLVVGPVFTQIANSLVDAFHQRAREVYGHRL